MTRWAVGLALLVSTCGSCAHAPVNRLVPMVLRPDTRAVMAAGIDSETVAATIALIRATLPSEAAFCYTGHLEDSTGTRFKRLLLTGVTRAVSDSADSVAVWFPNTRAGCGPEAVAIGHSHPYDPFVPCDHSDEDAYLLFGDPLVLVSVVWCEDGQLNYLWQDGTRTQGRWRS